MKATLWVAGLLGLALAVYLVAEAGAAAVGHALLVIGWGLVPVTLFHVAPLWFSTLSWRELLPSQGRPRWTALTFARWIRESVNSLLPVGQVGGDLVCIRLAHAMGVPGAAAAASMVVDLTVGVITQLIFVVLGLLLLIALSAGPTVDMVASVLLAGIGVFVIAIGLFVVVQHRGMFAVTTKLAGGLLNSDKILSIVGKAAEVDATVRAIYGKRQALIRSGVLRLIGWIVGLGEIWLIMYFLDRPITLAEAFVLESLGQGIRAVAFMVPGALGLLEGGYVVLGGLFGISPELSLAIALGKRVRELGLGLPGLVAWQIAEGHRFVRARKSR